MGKKIDVVDLTPEEYDLSRQLDKEILEERVASVDMTRYLRNRPDKAEYERKRDREIDLRRYWRDPDKRRKQALDSYYRHRAEKIQYGRRYYEEHKDERIVKQRAYYQKNKEEINRKRREKYAMKKQMEDKDEDSYNRQ